MTVTVWAIIKDTCELAGIPIPTIKELEDLLDDKTFDIYKNKLTSTINQVDSDYATELVARYKPRSVAEMSAFVAVIRPGCASLLQDFVDRKPYTTGVKELDDLLVDGENRMIYQELIMKYLIWLGIQESKSYDIIKKIAKKKFNEDELSELKKVLLKGWIKQVGSEDGFEKTWQVVNDASKYAFNASHSLSYAYDSLYGAYLKSHYPLEYYTVAFNYYSSDSARTVNLTKELKAFGIELKPIRFRYSNSSYSLLRKENSIYKGIQSIKYMNSKIAGELYELRNNIYKSFIDLLIDIKQKTSVDSRQLKILIELDFFEEFGDANYLLELYKLFGIFYNKVEIKKEKLETLNIDKEIVLPFAGKETEKKLTKLDTNALLIELSKQIKVNKRTLKEKIKAQLEHLEMIDIKDNRYAGMAVVMEVDTKYSPKFKAYSLKNGTNINFKIDKKTYRNNKIDEGDILVVSGTTRKPKKKKMEDGTFECIPNTSEIWLTKYKKLTDKELGKMTN